MEGILLRSKWKQGAFFLFQAVICYISSNHGTSYMEKLEHSSQQPAAYNAWNALLICYICECFLQPSSGYVKMYFYLRKKIVASLKV